MSPTNALIFNQDLWNIFPSTRGSSPVYFEENEHEYEITAELPGYDKNKINVFIEHNILKLTAECKRYGNMIKQFKLTNDSDIENIQAKYINGILTITIPKTQTSKRVISIQS